MAQLLTVPGLGRLRGRVLAFAFVLAGCAGAAAPPDEAGLCQLEQVGSDTTIVLHLKYSGRMLAGDINLEDYQAKGITSIASARARPKQPVYESEQRTDCYSESGKYWYPCKRKIKVDVGAAMGIARAEKMSTAKFLAKNGCEQSTTAIAAKALNTNLITSAALECEVVESLFCPIPPGKVKPTDESAD